VMWNYNSFGLNKRKSFIYVRAALESAGLVSSIFFSQAAFHRTFNLNYSQYVKPEMDFSYHHILNPVNMIVYHIAAGVGFPWGASTALPFEKSFFSGGTNSVRAWQARTLGPGSYKNKIFIEESGDMKFETNIEYRSKLFRVMSGTMLESAIFLDAGNVWTRNEDISRPGSKFEASNFVSELGAGAGMGLRFNFGFFILRVDAAVKIHDPSLDIKNRWVYPQQKFVISDVLPSLAIGYPFN